MLWGRAHQGRICGPRVDAAERRQNPTRESHLPPNPSTSSSDVAGASRSRPQLYFEHLLNNCFCGVSRTKLSKTCSPDYSPPDGSDEHWENECGGAARILARAIVSPQAPWWPTRKRAQGTITSPAVRASANAPVPKMLEHTSWEHLWANVCAPAAKVSQVLPPNWSIRAQLGPMLAQVGEHRLDLGPTRPIWG